MFTNDLAQKPVQVVHGFVLCSRVGLASLAGVFDLCLTAFEAGLSWTDSDLPLPGQGFAYLVGGVDLGCGGSGPLGPDTGAPRQSAGFE